MPPSIATAIWAIGILGLFVLDHDKKARTSKALWVTVVWLLIIASRNISEWLSLAPPAHSVDQYLEGSSLDGYVFTILYAIALMVVASRGRRIIKILRENRPILWFYLYCAASILWSDFPVVASKRWFKFVGDFAMVLIVLTETDPSAAVKRLLAWTSFLLVPASILLIKYYPAMAVIYRWNGTPLWSGVTTQKNDLGMICMIFGLASLWRLLQEFRGVDDKGRVGPLIAHATILAMVLWLFVKANSATSSSAFLLGGCLMVVIAVSSALVRRPAAVPLLLAAMLSLPLGVVFFDFGDLLGDLGRNSTLTDRTVLWSLALSMSANPLLGTGFDSFWLGDRLGKIGSIFGWFPIQVHNGYLEVYLNLGWIGVALLAVLLVTGYGNAMSAFRRDWRTGGLKLVYFLAALVYNLTEAGFKMGHPMWAIFLLASTAVPARVRQGVDIPHRVRMRNPGRHHIDLPSANSRAYEGGV